MIISFILQIIVTKTDIKNSYRYEEMRFLCS